MSSPLAVLRNGLGDELDKKRPPIFGNSKCTNSVDNRMMSHKAFLDIKALPSIQLNTLGRVRSKK